MNKLITWLRKIGILHEPKTINELFYEYGIGSCFRLFPPSFYRKHTPEEIKKAHVEAIAELRQILEDYKKENNIEDSV